MKRSAIFVDKDGTLIPDIPYNVDEHLITLSPGASEGLRLLANENFLLVVITNQQGIARGFFSRQQLLAAFGKISSLLAAENVSIDAFYHCPHYPDGSVPEFSVVCECRKPLPGMILQAAKEMNIDLSTSWMLGDILNDVEAGNRAGCRSILIDNGNETEWITSPLRTPAHAAPDILSAARFIIKQHSCEHREKDLAGL